MGEDVIDLCVLLVHSVADDSFDSSFSSGTMANVDGVGMQDVMGVSLQRTTGSHSRMSLDSRHAMDSKPTLDNKSALDSRTPALSGQQWPPSAEKPPKLPITPDASRQRARPPTPSRASSDTIATRVGPPFSPLFLFSC